MLLSVVALLLICVSIGLTSAKTSYVDDEGGLAAAGDLIIAYHHTAYAGKDIITHIGFPTQFRGYGTSPDDEIIKYEWDFDGDDYSDWHSTLSGEAFHIYNSTGTYYAMLRVYDRNNLTAMDSVKVTVKSGKGPQEYIEPMLPLRQVPTPPEADGINSRYAVMINGGYERRYWNDVTFMYSTLINDYGFTAKDIFLVNHDGTNPDGENPNNMIDYPASKSNLDEIFNDLAVIVDSDDLLFIFVTDHGRGYSGPQWTYYGYLSGFASVDPGDEQDYLESDFKLRSFCTYGNYYCNQGMDVWKFSKSWRSSHGAYQMYRNKYVSSFTNIYFEGPNVIISDDDIFIERFVDYLLGDTDRDGYVETSEGEVYDYDGDGNPPYDHATGTFDEDDWGEIDEYEDNIKHLNTGVPYDNYDYIIFDDGFDNCVDIDLYSACDKYHLEDCDVSLLEVDGTDLDNQGLFDGIDINDDGDMDDWVSIDERICLRYSSDDLLDDEMATYLSAINAGRIVVVMLPCFSGGFIEDLSDSNRVILTATVEELPSWGNRFLRRFTAALHRADIYGNPVNADSDGNGYISMLEAFNYAAENDYTPPQYDDNGDGIGHPYPIPNGGDGGLGAVTYLEIIPSTVSFVVSCDGSGTEWNTFDLSENVYCYAGNLPANTEVEIYVVDNRDDWKVGDSLTDVSGGEETVTTNSSGGIWPLENIWSSPLATGKYDIVVDIDKDGFLDQGEPIDSWATTGFEAIPEFPTIALPVIAIFGLIFLISCRKRKE